MEASAAQNAPVTKTCLQCGAVLPSNVRVCSFCDSSLAFNPSVEESPSARTGRNFTRDGVVASERPRDQAASKHDSAWRGELAQRLEAYRTRRRRFAPNLAQSQLPFDALSEEIPVQTSVAVAEPQTSDEDFSFTIAIGRNAATREDPRMVIDLSSPPVVEPGAVQIPAPEGRSEHSGLCPVACIEERRIAGLIDAACLLFAYGGFLALFGSLGGHFTLSKLSAAVCVTTFVIVYLQYFALFTVFGGTTPGMMLRGLHVVSYSGEPPAPRQMLWRSVGYMLSVGTFFMGFLWAMWDEDELTWHDRVSRTYLSPVQTFVGVDEGSAAHSR